MRREHEPKSLYILDAWLEFLTRLLCQLDRCSQSYRLIDIILHPCGIDVLKRRREVALELRRTSIDPSMILEIGSGSYPILSLLLGTNGVPLVAVDIKRDVFVSGGCPFSPLVASGTNLPFRDKIFGAVICIDTLEHIPKKSRNVAIKELLRVGERVIFRFPISSSDGLYRGPEYDKAFQEWHVRKFGVEDPNTAEHISNGYSTLEELQQVLPSGLTRYVGIYNCEVWLKYMTLGRLPIRRFLVGLLYYFLWKKLDDKPPFWGIMCVITQTFNKCSKSTR